MKNPPRLLGAGLGKLSTDDKVQHDEILTERRFFEAYLSSILKISILLP